MKASSNDRCSTDVRVLTVTAKKIPDVFSTHSAAKFCRVTPMTIIRWIEEGRINAYKTPGGHRRIMRDDLIVFCQSAGIPTDWAQHNDQRTRKVLVVDSDAATVNAILDDLLDAEDPNSPLAFQVEHAGQCVRSRAQTRNNTTRYYFSRSRHPWHQPGSDYSIREARPTAERVSNRGDCIPSDTHQYSGGHSFAASTGSWAGSPSDRSHAGRQIDALNSPANRNGYRRLNYIVV